MTFMFHGLSGHETMPMNRLFENRPVNKTDQVDAYHKINPNQPNDLADASKDKHLASGRGVASDTYKTVDATSDSQPALRASEIMSSPVATLSQTDSITEILKTFHDNSFRHLPVISPDKTLVGIVSDRDVFRYMSGIADDYNHKEVRHQYGDKVTGLMSSRVLSASSDTDVRYIARLFVEKRIGAMPILSNNNLVGIITRSDILGAVMRHFHLELWA